MLDEIKDLYGCIRIHWHAVAVAVAAALPSLLLYLEGIDLRPILANVLPENYVELIVALFPLVLAIMRPMVHLEAEDDDEVTRI